MTVKKHKQKLLQVRDRRILGEKNPKRVKRGQDMYDYGEQKEPVNLSLTPTAKAILTAVANEHKLSRSEYIEQYLRSLQ